MCESQNVRSDEQAGEVILCPSPSFFSPMSRFPGSHPLNTAQWSGGRQTDFGVFLA